jgi:4a-hydroxytetrahydrobiopterin dehydratase
MGLAQKHCVPCRGGVPPLKSEDLDRLRPEVPGWEVAGGHHLFRSFAFPDFRSALDLVNQVGAVAEQEGHHPDLCLSWGRVDISIWTHKIDGLTESDFILAAKINLLHLN